MPETPMKTMSVEPLIGSHPLRGIPDNAEIAIDPNDLEDGMFDPFRGIEDSTPSLSTGDSDTD